MELQRLYVRVLGDIQDFEKKMSKAERVTEQLGYDMKQFGKALTVGVSLPLAAVGAASVSAAADMDRLRRGLVAVMGSTGGATAELSKLESVAKLPGLGFREAIQGSIRLQAAFGDIEGRTDLARNALMAFGNAIATVGGGKAQLDRVTVALSQIAAKGKVSAEEILQLQEALPQIRQAMQSAFGTSSTEDLQKMGVSAEEFIRKITDEFAKLPKVTGGAANAFENFTDALFRARAAIGDQLLPVVVPLIEGIASLMEEVEGLDAGTVQNWIAFGAVLAGLGPAIILVGSLAQVFTALSVAGASVAAIFAIGAPLVVGLGVVAALWVKNALEAAAFRAELERMTTAASNMTAAVREMSLAQQQAVFADLASGVAMLRQRREALRADLAAAKAAPIKPIPGGQGVKDFMVEDLEKQLADVNRQIEMFELRIAEAARGFAFPGTVTDTPGGGVGAITSGAFASLADPLRMIDAELKNLRGREQDLMFEQALKPAAEAAEKLAEQLAEVRRQMVGLEAARLDFLRSDLVNSTGAGVLRLIGMGPKEGPHHGAINLGRSGASMSSAIQAAGMAGGAIGGRAGGFLSGAGGLAGGLSMGGMMGPFVALGGTVQVLDSLFGSTGDSVQEFRDELDRTIQALTAKFGLLDIDDADEQFRLLLEGFMEALDPASAARLDEMFGLSSLTPENFDERIGGILAALEEGQAGLDTPFGRLLQQLDALSDAIGETTRVLNAPSGFKVSLARFNATDAGGMGRMPGAFPSRGRGGDTFNITVTEAGNPRETARQVIQVIRREQGRGGTSDFGLAVGAT